MVSRVTVTIHVHLQRERPLVKAGHSRCRTMSQPIEQTSDLPVAEHTSLVLAVPGKGIEGVRIARRYQLQDPHFRRAKPRSAHRKFIEQLQHRLSKLRQET